VWELWRCCVDVGGHVRVRRQWSFRWREESRDLGDKGVVIGPFGAIGGSSYCYLVFWRKLENKFNIAYNLRKHNSNLHHRMRATMLRMVCIQF